MTQSTDMIAEDIETYLKIHENKTLLRFITCGSVDDGKSTLIGRLLYESHMVFEDQLEALEVDSRKMGTQGDQLDFALLVDGLGAEREQGITIDVAYRFFSTESRKFIVADTPGHEQYTRNMITGGSMADVAVLLVDARQGVLVQTRRHSYLASLLGIKHIVVAINKLDLLGYSQQIFDKIAADYTSFAQAIGLQDVTFIPISALHGDNIVDPSPQTPWYNGPTLMTYLETVDVADDSKSGSFRLPVQWVNRPDLDFRGFSGTIVSGTVAVGDALRVVPAGTMSTVARIVTMDGDLDRAVANQSVTITLADEIDCSRGDVLCAAQEPAGSADSFEADLVWMAENEMLPGRSYLLKLGARTVGVSFSRPKYRVNVNTMDKLSAPTLQLNEIGVLELTLDRPIAFDPYASNRETGGFIVIDRMTNATVGAGMLHFALRRSANVHWQALEIDAAAHARLKGHRPCTIWLTGLSGAGKSTIANMLERRLHAMGVHTVLLDGDNVRHGLNRDLGFSEHDRVENIRRVSEVSRLFADAGLISIVSFISPFTQERQTARALHEAAFCEVHVDTPLHVAETRDVKGLYAKARRGDLANFTGIDSPYEPPSDPEVRIDTTTTSPEEAATVIVEKLRALGVLT